MRKHLLWLVPVCLSAVVVVALLLSLRGRPVTVGQWEEAGSSARMRPDYSGIVIPHNIAPLNFVIDEPGSAYVVRIRSARGEGIEISGRSAKIVIPPEPWKRLLAANRGEELRLEVFARAADGQWRKFETVANSVAREPIDSHLAYRKIKPLYNYWGPVGIYQRNIETYDETQLFFNEDVDGTQRGCANCHTFNRNRADVMILHVRGPGGGMLLLRDGELTKIDTRTAYNPAPAAFASWHPSGRVLAFSVNKVRQAFHSARPEVRDAFDLNSDMAIYLLDSKSLTSTAAIRRPDHLETFPAWSADGEYLYFCRAPKLWTDDTLLPPERYRDVRYDLVRIHYDLDTGRWGQLETVLSAEETGKSITQPRISPDGRFAIVCMSGYSMQPSFQTDADLYLVDLQTRRYQRMACNSPLSESWHAWSSNGRWIVFSSKREDGQFIRAYFSHIDEDGTASKPFVLPQKDPAFYDSCIMLYQLPELITAAIALSEQDVLRVVRSGGLLQKSDAVTGASPVAGAGPQAPPMH